jgi:hypothetical protein
MALAKKVRLMSVFGIGVVKDCRKKPVKRQVQTAEFEIEKAATNSQSQHPHFDPVH